MTDMRSERLPQGANADHSVCHAEHSRCAFVPLLQWRGALSNPSWKVIVSASRGQYLKPGSLSPAFFLRGDS
jgi:hypothetical protein